MESAFLLLVANREPVFQQDDARVDEHALEVRARAQELGVFLLGAEAHDALHPGPVVPTPVKQHDFPSGGQVDHIALEVPLRSFCIRRFAKRHHAAATRVERLGNALDRTTLPSSVTTFKQHHQFLARGLDPVLHFHQFHVQFVQLGFILLALHLESTRCVSRSTCSRRWAGDNGSNNSGKRLA